MTDGRRPYDVGVGRTGQRGWRVDVDDLDGYLDRWSRAHGDYDVRSSPATLAWLRVAHRLASPLARRGVPPGRVTVLGGVGAAAIGAVGWLGGRWARRPRSSPSSTSRCGRVPPRRAWPRSVS